MDKPVTLPARLDASYPHAGYPGGWNACLDEIAKLGPLYTHADPAEVGSIKADRDAYVQNANDLRESLSRARKAHGESQGLMQEQIDTLRNEVERLRIENEALACNLSGKHRLAGATYTHLIQERDTQRAQLAGAANALLEHISGGYTGETACKIQEILAARAEPKPAE